MKNKKGHLNIESHMKFGSVDKTMTTGFQRAKCISLQGQCFGTIKLSLKYNINNRICTKKRIDSIFGHRTMMSEMVMCNYLIFS